MPASRTNSLAVVSLIAGIAAWSIAPFIGSIVAVVTGHMSRSQIRASQGVEDGAGLAMAGLVLGYLNAVVFVGAIVLMILVFAGLIGAGVFAGLMP